MRSFVFLLIGFFLGTFVSVSLAKYESGTNDAISIVGYGKTAAGALVAILVSADGTLQ